MVGRVINRHSYNFTNNSQCVLWLVAPQRSDTLKIVSVRCSKSTFGTAQMLLKKSNDPCPRIFRRRSIIPNVNHAERLKQQSVVIVKKRVARFRVLFHIVGDTCRSERLLQLLRHSPVPVVLGPIAPDNRACPRKKGLGIFRYRPAVIDACRSESITWRE